MLDRDLYFLALQCMPSVGPILSRQLVAHCGGLSEVFQASEKDILKTPGIGPSVLSKMNRECALEVAVKLYKKHQDHGIQQVSYLDDHYPQRLRHFEDSPVCLFYQGDIEVLNKSRSISVVGTRDATMYGRQVADHVIQSLSDVDPLIISGLAYGIDSIAHQAAIHYGMKTIAILGNGLPKIYPSSNERLAKDIVRAGGAIVTQFPIGDKPDREHFPMRNKIVAYLSDATLVVESKASGGSMITANFAFHNHRELFAVPGRTTDESSEGCNKLIQANMAQLAISGDDIMKSMNWTRSSTTKKQARLPIGLSEHEQLVYDVIKATPEIHINDLRTGVNLNRSRLAELLLEMEMSGLIVPIAGGRYLIA